MGILPDKTHPKPVRIEDVGVAEITYADYLFDDDLNAENQVLLIEEASDSGDDAPPREGGYQRTSTRRSARYDARKAIRQATRQAEISNSEITIKKHMGARKWRRITNARILASLIDPNDIRYDSSDLVPESMSAFARLMSDETCMRLWNELIDKNDEEQEQMLAELGVLDISDTSEEDDNDSDAWVELPKRAGARVVEREKRTRHPAYSAEACYIKLDKRFKNALSKRHGVPLKMLEELERDLRGWFSRNPREKFTANIPSEYRRFYLHAVAQFLRLKSQSSSQRKCDARITIIENPQNSFNPPCEQLHAFLNRSGATLIKGVFQAG